ncbi:MAG TPA: DUF1080 domain-containing protein, partial [Gemmataceae bacterium]|nr:DUF1080 domain-containing protein [Gemmataceae bacterium]
MSMHLRSLFVVPMMVAILAAIPAAGADPATVRLFNGKDFTNFYTFVKGDGKNNDSKKVFAVEDGVIHVSGESYGYLATEKEYENYHLTVEFKWGEKTYAPRKDKARDSGVLLHATGPDKIWPQCIECQMIEGGTCDIILVGGGKDKPTKLTAPAEQHGKQFWYSPGAPTHEFANERINWFGRDPEWKDVAGVRGPKDVERPLGQWNVIECDCDGPSINYKLNGVQMNGGTKANLTKG